MVLTLMIAAFVCCLSVWMVWVSDRLNALEVFLSAKPTVKFKRLHQDAVIPKYQTAGAVGMDLVACNDEPITIFPDDTMTVPTGLAIVLPDGYEGQVRSRSGLSIKGVTVANSPGTIDPDFMGQIMVIISNSGPIFTVHKGDRIAQLVIAKVSQVSIAETDTLPETARGAKGFGSTGI